MEEGSSAAARGSNVDDSAGIGITIVVGTSDGTVRVMSGPATRHCGSFAALHDETALCIVELLGYRSSQVRGARLCSLLSFDASPVVAPISSRLGGVTCCCAGGGIRFGSVRGLVCIEAAAKLMPWRVFMPLVALGARVEHVRKSHGAVGGVLMKN